MVTVRDIFDSLNAFAPVETKMDFDNVGLLVGTETDAVTRALVALDITDEVIDEAIDRRCQLIVSHHPMFFSLKRVVNSDIKGRKIIKLIQNNMSAVCMHTNLDAAEGGVNTVLARLAGITEPKKLYDVPSCIGLYGELEKPVELRDYLQAIQKALNVNALRYVSGGRSVHRLAVVGGSGGGDMERAVELGCDTMLTADIKYHSFVDAKELGLNLIDGDHFCTENPVVQVIKQRIEEHFPTVHVYLSEKHRQTVQIFGTREC